ncbi:MAG: S46 family peptidase, partial [Chitinophagaceae bacterium]|nr:S46 family peptidase [Chitinophagaceae bacterium]
DDPAFAFASAFSKNFNGKYLPYSQQFMAKNNDFARLYIKGIMEKDTVKAKLMYPDAAFNIRINTGNVKSYKPSASVSYDYVTTAAGLLEKYVAGDYEYDLPAKQVDLLKKKDFGIYADKIKKTLLINFITTNDITGGNSGSPILNANGEMMGLAYDLNYEGLGHKIAFDKNLNRTVCVDIRYVLWCIDKLGGAAGIMKEFKII